MQTGIALPLALCVDAGLTSWRTDAETVLMTRVAVGGFLHETNTFAPTKATYDAFVHGGGWPSMEVGGDILKVIRNINVGLAGFIDAGLTEGWELAPTVFAAATPSAHVTRDAYERIAKVLID